MGPWHEFTRGDGFVAGSVALRIGCPDLARDVESRREVYGLFEAIWPGLSGRIALAERAGAEPWHRISTPFVAYDGDQPVAHVGVIAIPLMLAGAPLLVAGIHAVGTHPAHRRRGYARRLLEKAVTYCEDRFASAQLTTELPDVFRGAGFRVVPQTRFEVAPSPRRSPGFRPLAMDSAGDRLLLDRLLRRRQPISRRLSSLDPGWLFVTDEVLATGSFTRLYYAADLDLVAAYEIKQQRLCLYDLVGEELPALGEVLSRIPEPHSRVDLFFTPDRFEVEILSESEAYPGDTLMVRGTYPVEGERIVLPPLAHC
jgi:GNAT superfamily N-acetyltransferase